MMMLMMMMLLIALWDNIVSKLGLLMTVTRCVVLYTVKQKPFIF